MSLGFCNKGTALAGPQAPQSVRGALAPADPFLGALSRFSLSAPCREAVSQEHDVKGCGKTQPRRLCNKGTALAGPQAPQSVRGALAPEGRISGCRSMDETSAQ